MNGEAKQILEDANRAIREAIEEARKKRNEEDRKFIIAGIGKDLALILKPLLEDIAKNSKLNREDLKEIIKGIKIEAPQVNVSAPEVKVSVPDVIVPEIKIPDIKIPAIKVPAPQVTVKSPEFKMPKEMEVKGLMGMMKTFGDTLKKKLHLDLGGINRDHPMAVTLVDEDGNLYKAMASLVGGGGPRIISIKEVPAPTGSDAINNGIVTVSSAGTRVQLPNAACRRVYIQAAEGNTGRIVVGGSDVIAALATRNSRYFYKTWGDWFNVSNLNMLWVDATAANQKISYFYEK